MVKKYVTTLRNGAKEQKASILGRTITLYDGEVVTEGILTKAFPSLFEEIVEITPVESSKEEVVEDVKVEEEAPVEKDEEILIEDSSDVKGVEVVEDVKVEKITAKPKSSKSRKN